MAATAYPCFAGAVAALITFPPLALMLAALLLIAAAAVKTAINNRRSRLHTAVQGQLCTKEVSPPPRTAMYGQQLRKFGENLQRKTAY